MIALIIGAAMIFFTVFAALPPETAGFGLGWGKDNLLFLRGGLPIFTAFGGYQRQAGCEKGRSGDESGRK